MLLLLTFLFFFFCAPIGFSTLWENRFIRIDTKVAVIFFSFPFISVTSLVYARLSIVIAVCIYTMVVALPRCKERIWWLSRVRERCLPWNSSYICICCTRAQKPGSRSTIITFGHYFVCTLLPSGCIITSLYAFFFLYKRAHLSIFHNILSLCDCSITVAFHISKCKVSFDDSWNSIGFIGRR